MRNKSCRVKSVLAKVKRGPVLFLSLALSAAPRMHLHFPTGFNLPSWSDLLYQIFARRSLFARGAADGTLIPECYLAAARRRCIVPACFNS